MKTDSATWKEWVDSDLEGELGATEKARLERVLEVEPGAREERRALTALHRMLDEGRVDVVPSFTERVMSALPAAWWERRRKGASLPSWALPLAMMLALALSAAFVLGNAETGRAAGIGLALLDFARVTLLAGAGMLFATWRGIGFGVEQLIADSGLSLVALASAVVFLNLLFFSLLKRRKAAPAAKSAEPES